MIIKRTQKARKIQIYPYLFLAPFVVVALVVTIVPIVLTFFISFHKWDGLSPMTFVGLANYARLLQPNSRFFLTLFNTVVIMLMSIPMNLFLALGIAALLNSKYTVCRKSFQLINFLPYLTTPVAIGILFALLFDWQYGTLNQMAMQVGLISEPINWLGEPARARVTLAFLYTWKNYGYLLILFMAGMTAISEEVYEAAELDGATGLKKFFRITLPLLRPVLTFVVVTSIILGFQMFDEPFLLFKGGLTGPQPFGGPQLAGLTMVMNLYDASFRTYDMGFGACLSYSMLAIISVFSFISLKFMMKGEDN